MLSTHRKLHRLKYVSLGKNITHKMLYRIIHSYVFFTNTKKIFYVSVIWVYQISLGKNIIRKMLFSSKLTLHIRSI